MSELFEIKESLSPRLKWLREHGVKIIHNVLVKAGDEDEFSGEPIYPYCATDLPIIDADTDLFSPRHAGFGNTEDEAIVNLAKANGWKLWSEI
jgi:hypothetical protein